MQGDEVLMTYMGRRWSSKNKIAYAWLKEDGAEGWWEKSPAPFASIGQVWRFTVANDAGAMYTSGEHKPVFLYPTPTTDRLDGWVAAEKASLVQEANFRMAKNSKLTSGVEDAIAILNKAYWTLNSGVQKTAFMMYVEEEMTRYGR